MSRRLLIIGAARRFAPLDIAVAGQLGHSVVVVTDHGLADSCSRWVEDIIAVPSLRDRRLVTDTVVAYHRRRRFDGVFSMIWWCPPLVASVAERLGLPGPDPTVSALAEDKRRFREAMRARGLADLAPRFAPVPDAGALGPAAEHVGFPAVIKQTNSAGQHNVFLVEDPQQLRSRYEAIRREKANISGVPTEPGVILEEYVAGDEYTFECLVHEGRVYPVQVFEWRKVRPPSFVGVESNYDSGWSNALRERLTDAVRRCFAGLGIRHGSWHLDLLVGAEGTVKVVEVANRHGGGRIHELVGLSSGMNLYDQAFRVAFGDRPVLERTRDVSVAERFMVRNPGTVVEVTIPPVADPRVYDVQVDPEVGDVVHPLAHAFHRVGQIISFGDRLKELRDLNRQIDESIRISVV